MEVSLILTATSISVFSAYRFLTVKSPHKISKVVESEIHVR